MTQDAITRGAKLSCFDNPTQIEPLSGGITNVNLRVTDGDRRFVVRLGEDIPEHGVLRWNELALSRAAEAAGVSPAVHHHEPGVLVLEFIEAQTFDEEMARDPCNVPRIVDLLKTTHHALGSHLTTPVLTFWPFQVNRTYATRLRSDGSGHSAKLPALMRQLDSLEAATGAVTLVIGHNDLLAANILDDGTQLWLIDWEYGGFNTPLFDLAGLAGNNGFSEAQEAAMLEQYFDAPASTHWRAYQAMKCTSLMREALWSMTSEIHSELDFDYAAYTAENLARFDAALQDFQNT
ncbi:choline kinase family protein [Marivita sp. S6314]|uniref:choline kinase family protein n=1 Tax=Marivita sp. S6314 TaxID=2926406 RepID=UPI001FF3DCB3|nr:choline kinase family protein [Marivita sp. S6314]MCK0150676.1 choline kinase family protein [Marivita sp. S6314]